MQGDVGVVDRHITLTMNDLDDILFLEVDHLSRLSLVSSSGDLIT